MLRHFKKILLIISIILSTQTSLAGDWGCDRIDACSDSITCWAHCVSQNTNVKTPTIGIVKGTFKVMSDSVPGNDHVQFILRRKWGECCNDEFIDLRGESESGKLFGSTVKVGGRTPKPGQDGNNTRPNEYFKNPELQGRDPRFNTASTAYCVVAWQPVLGGYLNFNEYGDYNCLGMTYYFPPPLCESIEKTNDAFAYRICDSTAEACRGVTNGNFSYPKITMYNTSGNTSFPALQTINYCKTCFSEINGNIYFLTKPANPYQICAALFTPSGINLKGCEATDKSGVLNAFSHYQGDVSKIPSSEYQIVGCINTPPLPMPTVTADGSSTNENPRMSVSMTVDEKKYEATLSLENPNFIIGPEDGNQITLTSNIYGGRYKNGSNPMYDEYVMDIVPGRCVMYNNEEYYVDGLEYENKDNKLKYIRGGKKMCLENYVDEKRILVNMMPYGDINNNLQYGEDKKTLLKIPGMLKDDVANFSYVEGSNIPDGQTLVAPNGHQRDLCVTIPPVTYPPGISPPWTNQNSKACSKIGQKIYKNPM